MTHRTRKFVALAALAALTASSPAHAATLCKAQLDCPTSYSGDTAYVSDSVVLLSETFAHCSPDSFREGVVPGSIDTISLFFIIDHSSSMSYMDSTGSRYRLVEQIIDSLAVKSPASEVGIAVFSNQLLHNYQQDPFFVQLDPASGWHDSYVPLTRLDATVGGMSAVDKLKWSIARGAVPGDTDLGGNRRLFNADYGMTGRHSGWDAVGNPLTGYNGTTDITLGFQAAIKAFKTARYPRQHQFIIFLSDGVQQFVDVERRPYDTLYVRGDSVPTTFTAFFINQMQPIPDQIQRMTQNIKNNGYSSRNPSSDVWKTQGNETGLIDRLLDVTAGNNQRLYPSTPLSMTMNGVTTTTFNGDLAVFPAPFVLTGQSTPFTASLIFQYDPPLTLRDTLNASFTVSRVQTAPVGKQLISGSDCWEQGTLELRFNSTVVSIVQPNFTQLQIRFYPPTAFPINSATLVVMNASRTDSLVLTANNTGSYFSATFNRATGTPSIDNILQNGLNDSIIVYYRNPAIPLDIVRGAWRVAPARDLQVSKAYYLDQAGGIADGRPDLIRVEIGDVLTQQELDLIRDGLNVQSPLRPGTTRSSIVLNSHGFDIVLTESATDTLLTRVNYPNERLYINAVGLPDGNTFPETDIAIADSMAPVILSANLYDVAVGLDTLEVIFSEPVKAIGNATPFEFMRPGTSDSTALRLSLVSVAGATARFTVVAGQANPQQGDSVWISTTANVSDTLGNRQDANNIRRQLDVLRLFMPLTAAYVDTNADGLIDIIRVTMDRPPSDSLMAAMIPNIALPAYRNFTYSSNDFVITTAGFDIHVTQPASTVPFTGVNSQDRLAIREAETTQHDYCPNAVLPIADILPPVITKAEFRPKSGGAPFDTLVVTFSEPIDVPTVPQTFILTDSAGVQHVVTVTPLSNAPGTAQVFLVDNIQGRNFVYVNPRDSLRINPAANVADTSGNIQNNDNNRKQPILIGAYHYKFVVHSASNPFKPGSGATTKIKITPADTVGSFVTISGKLTVFDCLGNIVFLDNKAGVTGIQEVDFEWNGANRNGRIVGSGSYLAVMAIEDNQNNKETKKLKIGVKR